MKGDTILIRGYAGGYNFDLGVREHQKVENPCCIQTVNISLLHKPGFFRYFRAIEIEVARHVEINFIF